MLINNSYRCGDTLEMEICISLTSVFMAIYIDRFCVYVKIFRSA